MQLSFIDLCIIQAMSNTSGADADDNALKHWAHQVVKRAQALDAARQTLQVESAENESERVNKELETRSAIS